jgi:hypothetical protein
MALSGVLPGTIQAQTNPPDTTKGSAPAATKGEEGVPKAAPATSGAEPPRAIKLEPELWAEPNRQELLKNTFRELNGPPFVTPAEANRVLDMARGRSAVDQATLTKYVQYYAAELTKHASIQSLLNPQAGDRGSKALEEATNRLVRPLLEPETPANATFRTMYVKVLASVAPLLLKGHLHTRTFFMVVLSRANSPAVVPTLIGVLKDPDQPATVKMLAAVGLTNATNGGRQNLDAVTQANPAAQAVADVLNNSEDIFWPIRSRLLEALGSLRRATANALEGKAEFTNPAFEALTDKEAKPDVRAWGGWALGMIDVPGQIAKFNYALVAYEMGQAAVDIGTMIVQIPVPAESPTLNLRLVPRYVDPLLRLEAGMAGEPGVRNSGLQNISHVQATAARQTIREIDQRMKAVAERAIEFSNSVGSQVIPAHKALATAVDDLKSYLAKNRPESNELYPDGPTVELPPEPKKATASAPGR